MRLSLNNVRTKVGEAMKRITTGLTVGSVLLAAATWASAQDGKGAKPAKTSDSKPVAAKAAAETPKSASDSERIASLESEIGDLKKLVAALVGGGGAGTAPATEATSGTRKSVGGVEKPQLGATIGGYFSLEYRDEEGPKKTEFDQHRLIILLNSWISDYVEFDAEIEIEGGGADVGFLSGNEILVEYAELRFDTLAWSDAAWSDLLTVKAGLILVPFGKFNSMHDDPLNDLTDRPFIRRVLPVAFDQPGVGLEGSLPMGTWGPLGAVSVSYDAAVIQGFINNFTNNGGGRDARNSFRADNNNWKDVVGRFSFASFPGKGNSIELGVSGYYGKYDVRQDREITGFAVDASWRTGALGTAAGFDFGSFELIAEYQELNLHRKDIDGPALGATRGLNAYYVQANFHFWPSSWRGGLFNKESTFTAVVRYEENDLNDRVTGSAQNDDRSAITFGLNLRITEKTVFKVSWQKIHSAINNADTDNLELFVMSIATYF
jgi:hypothetical protein